MTILDLYLSLVSFMSEHVDIPGHFLSIISHVYAIKQNLDSRFKRENKLRFSVTQDGKAAEETRRPNWPHVDYCTKAAPVPPPPAEPSSLNKLRFVFKAISGRLLVYSGGQKNNQRGGKKCSSPILWFLKSLDILRNPKDDLLQRFGWASPVAGLTAASQRPETRFVAIFDFPETGQQGSRIYLVTEMASEKFCLRWNDFETNISVAFRELREDKDFFDVTLACDDQ